MAKKPKATTQISAKDFANLKGISFKSVYNAVKSGRLTPIDPNVRGLKFDRARAEIDWELYRKDKHIPKSKRGETDNGSPDKQPDLFDENSEVTRPNAKDHQLIASAKHEKFKAENERLKFEEQLGKLVDAEDVRRESFQIARITRDAMLSIPDRISAQLCGITDPVAMHATLTKELNGALDQLVKKYCASPPPDAYGTATAETVGAQSPESVSGGADS
jgi:phage terminase Nu1 subunit (DNA packaging protein)